jgi:ethanolamine utilization protein EutN
VTRADGAERTKTVFVGIVEGNATSHIKHPSMDGWRLLIVQPLGITGTPDGEPILAVDSLGAGDGAKVVISNDGRGARDLVGDDNSPVRWTIIGIVD